MKISSEELIGLYSFLGYKFLNGIDVKYDMRKETSKERVNRLVTSYIVKGLVDENKKFTKAGDLLLKIIDSYAKSEKKILINQMRIAVCENCLLIVFHLIRNRNYEITDVDIHLCNENQFLNTITRDYPDLCAAYTPGKLYEKNKLLKKDFFETIKLFNDGNMIFIGDDNNDLKVSRIIFWKGDICYCYYVNDEIREKIEVGYIRQIVWQLFKVG